ncbi:response regulator [Oscillatoria sp. CS-180]|uniref:response regulator n=1 Tax=Oscillatoria sp. CS-180 TaxID=3021720 RepID=UPI00232E5DB3|nr:response regulator [Oscillatoria sp. CS-180]MDB9527314.1 response regulator [Oscillatoria sp. CS-180]
MDSSLCLLPVAWSRSWCERAIAVKRRILLIDDEVDIHKITQVGLMMAAGWELLTAQSSAEGLDIVLSEPLDAVLLDVMMPECDGIETLQRIQESSQAQTIPVIFLTAKARSADRRQLYALGAKGVITKPFDPLTLASQISGFLGWS